MSNENAINAIVRCLPSLLVSLEREASENGEPITLGLHQFNDIVQVCSLCVHGCWCFTTR